MGSTKTIKFRIIVVLLLILIIWQTYRLYPRSPVVEKLETKKEEIPPTPEKIVNVEVYYEALCPDSRHFFLHHLVDTFSKMKDNMKLTLIPYGKAKTIESSNGLIYFECQHGELECQANKVHACCIEHIRNPSDLLGLINCMIKDNMDPDLALTNCASTFSIDTTVINECARSARGDELLKIHGQATNLIKPMFIPTILIEGRKDNQGAILKNFKLELCKSYHDYKTPEACL